MTRCSECPCTATHHFSYTVKGGRRYAKKLCAECVDWYLRQSWTTFGVRVPLVAGKGPVAA